MTDPHSASAFHPESIGSIGIRFDRLLAEARACWLTFAGSSLRYAPEVRAIASEPMPSELLRQMRSIERDESTHVARDVIATELTSIASRLCHRLISNAAESEDDILAVGIHGAGIWDVHESESRSYVEQIQSVRLAEQFGKTIIDDFPSRDLAQGGRGGPVETHGLWLLLADRSNVPGRRWRALLDISAHATHFSMIRPLDQQCGLESSLSNNICVGSRLLVEIKALVDRDGRGVDDIQLATEAGKVIPELDEMWRAESSDAPSWNPEGVSALTLVYALQNSIFAKAPPEDLLATACCFIARQIAIYVCHGVSPSHPVGELFVMGEGSKSGLIMQWLAEFLPGVSIRHLAELGHDRTILSASIAALTLLHLWQIPVPSTNSAGVPRVLGRITPGSPNNWQRVLRTMTSNAPWLLPLREAI